MSKTKSYIDLKEVPMSKTKSYLEIKNLKKWYVPGDLILKGINISITKPEVIAIIGPSGTGKSTLLRCINRLVDPNGGEIIFKDLDLCQIKGSTLRKVRRHMGMVFQEYNLVERLSVIENVLTGRLGYMTSWQAFRKKFSQKDINTAYELLKTVGLSDHAKKRADSLSGGQRQRVGIARAVMQNPDILLADEPTSSLDPKTAVEIMELITDFSKKNNIPAIVNMHDVKLAQRFATRIIGMSEGYVVYDGEPSGITDTLLKEIYGGEEWME